MPEDMKTDAWVMVPRQPGGAMIAAGVDERDRPGSGGAVGAIYRAMVAAAPTPPTNLQKMQTAPPVGVREEDSDLARHISVHTVEEDEDTIRLTVFGQKIAAWSAYGEQGIALLKLAASLSAASVIAPVEEMDLWPDDPAPIADKAADHVFKDFAKALGLETWHPQDGSESWEGDVWATAVRMLEDAGVLDPETGKRHVIAPVEGVGEELPNERVCIPDPSNPSARIVGFRIREGDAAWGDMGLSEPLRWLDRLASRSALVASPPSDRAGVMEECMAHLSAIAEAMWEKCEAERKNPFDDPKQAESEAATTAWCFDKAAESLAAIRSLPSGEGK